MSYNSELSPIYNLRLFFAFISIWLTASDYITSTLQRHEKRLEEHDVILEKKKIDVTSLQHQLIRMLRKGAARDAAISTLRRVVSNTSTGQGQVGSALIDIH